MQTKQFKVARYSGDVLHYFSFRHIRPLHELPIEYYHTHNGLEILYVYEGTGHLILDDCFYEIKPRMLIILKPYQLHFIHFKAEVPYKSTLFIIEPHFIEQSKILLPHFHHLIFELLNENKVEQVFYLSEHQHERLDQLFHQLYQSLQHRMKTDLRNEVVILFTMNFFLELFLEIVPKLKDKEIHPLRITLPVEEVLQWIDLHFRERVTMERIAEELHQSVHHMLKQFRRQVGKTIHTVIMEKRLEYARIILHSDQQSIETISHHSGFNSPSYFIRVFKKKYGVTPHQYRLNLTKMYSSQ